MKLRLGDRPSRTAQHTALARAVAHELGVLNDPFAFMLLRGGWSLAARIALSPALARLGVRRVFLLRSAQAWVPLSYLTARTLFFDDAVHEGIARGCKQIVTIGAGYDVRALRFVTPGVTFFEVDQPATQADKRLRLGVLGEGDCARFAGADVERDDLHASLRAVGYDAASPAIFLCEGVIEFLSEAGVTHLLTGLRACAATGSTLVANFPTKQEAHEPSVLSHAGARLRRSLRRMRSERPRFNIPDWEVPPLLQGAGWRPVRRFDAYEAFAAHLADRGLPYPAIRGGRSLVVATAADSGPPSYARDGSLRLPVQTTAQE
ncbi:class I SAM-dependent methyltransferase [Nonomuraea lactucae]|uniref:class I SAM-dependent methyltransferase n=1 Tax=Nonomuraea lactucae TaxID=2249762 RepID=UPI000DE50753|nr:SAM-dependent methyltransferase [Nonomuraea lactucae]